MTYESVCISAESAENSVLVIRIKKAILDRVLASCYGDDRVLKRRVPTDFTLRLSIEKTSAPTRKQKTQKKPPVRQRKPVRFWAEIVAK